MRILVLADEESKYFWDHFEQSKLDGIDLILSCGDLKPEYLSFLATFAKVPILYVRGNHDDVYEERPPEGCICIEDNIYTYQGVRILGLGGSIRYKQGKNQYTQSEMRWRVRKLWWKLKRNKGFDILLTHAPAYHVNDGEDGPHEGFEAFVDLLEKYKPKCFIHGHVHMTYSRSHKRESVYKDTRVINGFEKYIFDF
ncbi:MAG: metallophosphoesterase [Lachnospiraceae bacterium]|nr:metallophosphoesterase [Lachnospiraceae bacterium]